MSRASPEMRNFAQRLIAYETKGNRFSEARPPAAVLICEKLRPQLAIFMGKAGFRALVGRALALAKAEGAWSSAVHVRADGALEGWDQPAAQVGSGLMAEDSIVLVAQLLGLLVTFIGEDLTVRLVREAWPKLSVNELDLGEGGKSEKTK